MFLDMVLDSTLQLAFAKCCCSIKEDSQLPEKTVGFFLFLITLLCEARFSSYTSTETTYCIY